MIYYPLGSAAGQLHCEQKPQQGLARLREISSYSTAMPSGSGSIRRALLYGSSEYSWWGSTVEILRVQMVGPKGDVSPVCTIRECDGTCDVNDAVFTDVTEP